MFKPGTYNIAEIFPWDGSERKVKITSADWVLCAAPLTEEESFEAVNTYLEEKEKQDEVS